MMMMMMMIIIIIIIIIIIDQLSRLICEKDNDEYRGPDSSIEGEGG
jgi:ABC-type cobalt transport system substrate-binding protein